MRVASFRPFSTQRLSAATRSRPGAANCAALATSASVALTRSSFLRYSGASPERSGARPSLTATAWSSSGACRIATIEAQFSICSAVRSAPKLWNFIFSVSLIHSPLHGDSEMALIRAKFGMASGNLLSVKGLRNFANENSELKNFVRIFLSLVLACRPGALRGRRLSRTWHARALEAERAGFGCQLVRQCVRLAP